MLRLLSRPLNTLNTLNALNPFIMNTYIESLAREKDFLQLTADERTAVLSEMTEEEYEQLRLTISTLRSMDADARPSPQLRERLLRHMAEGAQPRLPWHRQPVQMWQAAAAALLVGVAVAACFFPTKSQQPEEPLVVNRTEITVQHDTVWLTKWAYRNRVVYLRQPESSEKEPFVSPPQAFVKMPSAQQDAASPNPLPSAEFSLPTTQPTGTPLSALPELMQFLGGENKKR